jgi:hypothetical protein
MEIDVTICPACGASGGEYRTCTVCGTLKVPVHTNEMIERVMMAIQLAAPYIRKELAEQAARAAIAAMREPTEGMRHAGGAVITSYPNGPSDVDKSVAAVTFEAMIDAALSPE